MSVVFDASALLVLLNKEPGHELVERYLPQAMMSAVNFAEVITVLVNVGVPLSEATTLTSELITIIEPFNADQAVATAELRKTTKTLGLSLGDRACLALAQKKQLPVITADKIWKEIKLPIEIKLAR